MKFGHFDDKAREYVIETPRTPYPWINYLGCEKFFGIISNTAGGYCFYRDARLPGVNQFLSIQSAAKPCQALFFCQIFSKNM